MRFVLGHARTQQRIDFSDAMPFKIDGDYCKLIQLTKGHFHVVDASRYEDLSRFAWHLLWSENAKSFYAHNKRVGSMHRYILGLSKGDLRTGDHVDPARTWDNRRRNLRLADKSQQQHNTRQQKNNTSGYKGVSWNRRLKRYVAMIGVNGKSRYLGSDINPTVCAEMYQAAALKEYGEFARF